MPSMLNCNAGTATMNSLLCCNKSSTVVITTIDLLSDDSLQGTQRTLKGTIPTSLGLLSSLVTLKLGVQCISGSLPSEIGMMSSLSSLGLQQNSFTHNIPTTIGNLLSLSYLALQDNAFSGNIPTSLGRLSNLQILNLGNNVNAYAATSIPSGGAGLRGSIPSTFSALGKLTYLNIGNNLIAGTIPTFLASLTFLQELDLDVNFLTGSVPPSFCNSSATLKVFRFSVNQLCCYASCLSVSPGNKVFGASDSVDNQSVQRNSSLQVRIKMKSCTIENSLGLCNPTSSPTKIPTSQPTAGLKTIFYS